MDMKQVAMNNTGRDIGWCRIFYSPFKVMCSTTGEVPHIPKPDDTGQHHVEGFTFLYDHWVSILIVEEADGLTYPMWIPRDHVNEISEIPEDSPLLDTPEPEEWSLDG
jgi:hypothetical protein